jgi:hypothetical protein
MSILLVSNVFSKAWTAFKKEWLKIVGITFGYFAISYILQIPLLFIDYTAPSAGLIIASLPGFLIALVLAFYLLKIFFDYAKTGALVIKVKFPTIKALIKSALLTVVFLLLVSLVAFVPTLILASLFSSETAVLITTVLVILLMSIVAVCAFAPYFFAILGYLQNDGFKAGIKTGLSFTKKNFLKIILIVILVFVISFIGNIIIVGALVTTPLVMLVVIFTYLDLKSATGLDDSNLTAQEKAQEIEDEITESTEKELI